jgi:hypothetical protein
LGAGGELADLTDFGGKIHGQVVRLAAVSHLAENVANRWGEPIGLASMERAITLADYFTAHSLAVFDFMDPRRSHDDAATVLRWIADQRKRTFTRRECHRAHEARFPTAEDVTACLATLEAHGYVRALEALVPSEKGGRPSHPYAVNPKWLDTTDKTPSGLESGDE